MNASDQAPLGVIQQLGGIDEARKEFIKNPLLVNLYPNTYRQVLIATAFVAEKAYTQKYLMDGLNEVFGYYPTEEQLEELAKKGYLTSITFPPNHHKGYKQVWQFDNQTILIRLKTSTGLNGLPVFNFKTRTGGKFTLNSREHSLA